MAHSLSGCTNRALFQIKRVQAFIALVNPIVPRDDDDANRQYLYQTSILMIQSFLEEYFRHVVALGTWWKTDQVRAHLSECYRNERFDLMPLKEVGEWAQKRVSFDEDATRLRSLMKVLVGVDPLVDAVVRRKCLDFVNVRNLISHRGGWPDEKVAPTILSENVIVETTNINGSQFYKLRISGGFFSECLEAVGRVIVIVDTAASQDSDLGGPE